MVRLFNSAMVLAGLLALSASDVSAKTATKRTLWAPYSRNYDTTRLGPWGELPGNRRSTDFQWRNRVTTSGGGFASFTVDIVPGKGRQVPTFLFEGRPTTFVSEAMLGPRSTLAAKPGQIFAIPILTTRSNFSGVCGWDGRTRLNREQRIRHTSASMVTTECRFKSNMMFLGIAKNLVSHGPGSTLGVAFVQVKPAPQLDRAHVGNPSLPFNPRNAISVRDGSYSRSLLFDIHR